MADWLSVLRELIRASTDFAIVLATRVIFHEVTIVAIAAIGLTSVVIALPILRVAVAVVAIAVPVAVTVVAIAVLVWLLA